MLGGVEVAIKGGGEGGEVTLNALLRGVVALVGLELELGDASAACIRSRVR